VVKGGGIGESHQQTELGSSRKGLGRIHTPRPELKQKGMELGQKQGAWFSNPRKLEGRTARAGERRVRRAFQVGLPTLSRRVVIHSGKKGVGEEGKEIQVEEVE